MRISAGRKQGSHHAKPRRQPYAWLGAGAITLGMGVAMANGTAVAHADSTESDNTNSATTADSTPNSGPNSAQRSNADESPKADDHGTGDSDSDPADSTDEDDSLEAPADDDEADVEDLDLDDRTVRRSGNSASTLEYDAETEKPSIDIVSVDADTSILEDGAAPLADSDASAEETAGEWTVNTASLPDPDPSTAVAFPDGSTIAAAQVVEQNTAGVLTGIGLRPSATDFPLPTLPVPSFAEALWLAARQNASVSNAQRAAAATTTSGQDPLTGQANNAPASLLTPGASLSAAQAAPPSLAEILQYTFFHRAPTADPAQSLADPATGTVTGDLHASSPTGGPLTYSVTRGPSYGNLVVSADGTYVYTPQVNPTRTTGTDSFTITVDNGSAYRLTGLAGAIQAVFHSLAQALGLSGQDRSAITVHIANQTPTITGYTTTDPDADSVVSGSITATDVNGDPLTYTVSAGPAPGATVILNPNGTFSYTPNDEMRHLAAADGAPPSALSDSFTVQISDGFGGTPTITVTVPIGPKNTAPQATPSVTGDPDPSTGSIAGQLNATDADQDPLTYVVTTNPGKGTVTVDANGSYQYAPTAAAQHAASADNAASADTTDTFTVTVSDGHGGTVLVPVRVVITPANTAPSGGTATGLDADNATGVVTGSITGASDADGDTLSYTASATSVGGGTVTIDPVTGAFVYTPTTEQRDNAAANTIIDTITGFTQPWAVTISPDGSRAYVTDLGGGVRVVDTATNTIIGSLGVITLNAVAVSPDGTRAYATYYQNNSLSVIDIATGTVIATVSDINAPGDVVVHPDGSRVYVLRPGGALTVIDAATNTIISTITTGYRPGSVAVSPDGTRIYVPVTAVGTAQVTGVRVIDTATNTIVGIIDVDRNPTQVAVSPDGKRVYVTAYSAESGGAVLTIDTDNMSMIATVPISDWPNALAVSPDGNYVYVSAVGEEEDSEISVIDTATNSVTATISGFYSPTDLAISRDGTRAYVVADGALQVVKIGANDTFTVTVSDGHGGSSDVEVTVPVSPAFVNPAGAVNA